MDCASVPRTVQTLFFVVVSVARFCIIPNGGINFRNDTAGRASDIAIFLSCLVRSALGTVRRVYRAAICYDRMTSAMPETSPRFIILYCVLVTARSSYRMIGR